MFVTLQTHRGWVSTLTVAAALTVLTATTALAGGGGEPESSGSSAATTAPAISRTGGFGEAPMLAALVNNGELPSVDQRVSEDPLVLPVREEIGQYGGQANLFYAGARGQWHFDMNVVSAWEFPLGYAEDLSTIEPNIARAVDLTDNSTVLTLHLRRGMKWSDGDEFDADDFMFWYQDVLQNTDITPRPPAQVSVGGELMQMSKVDAHTVRIEFAGSYPSARLVFTHPWGGLGSRYPGYAPRHFLEQFHADYNDKAGDLANAAGFDHWYQYFSDRANNVRELPAVPERPTIGSYKLVQRETDFYLFERNPYYWKVDPENNQLPYIDRVLQRFVSDAEIALAKVTSGEADFAFRFLSIEDFPLVKDNEPNGKYQTILAPISFTPITMRLNQTVEDPVLRPLFQDVRFRRALSLGIDRNEINELVFFGLGSPGQWTVSSANEYYVQEARDSYAQHDPDAANRLLDQLGLQWDSQRRYRVRSDGKELAIEGLFSADHIGAEATAELLKEQLVEIGINLNPIGVARDILSQRAQANTVEVSMWLADGGNMFTTLPHAIIPTSNAPWFAGSPRWALWFASGGEEGIEPPDVVKSNYEKWQQMLLVPDAERVALGREIMRSQGENLFTIGTVAEAPSLLMTARDNMGNIPVDAPLFDQAAGYTVPFHPETFFFRHPLYPNQQY